MGAKQRATIYLREHLAPILGESSEGLSLRIAAILVRYEQIVRALMPEFSRAEWCAIMDANNGGTDLFTADGHPMPSGIWANVHDSPGLDEKWDIDQKRLVKRLQKLSPAELLAVDEAIARFWQVPERDTDEALEHAWCKVD